MERVEQKTGEGYGRLSWQQKRLPMEGLLGLSSSIDIRAIHALGVRVAVVDCTHASQFSLPASPA